MSPSQLAITQWGWVSTPCGAVSTRGICVFVPGLLELCRYGRISDLGMGTYAPRGVLALCTIPSQSAIGQWDWGFHTVRDGFDPGVQRFRHQDVGAAKLLKDF